MVRRFFLHDHTFLLRKERLGDPYPRVLFLTMIARCLG